MNDVSDRLEIKIISIDDLSLVEGTLPTSFVEVVVGADKKCTHAVPESKNPVFDSDPMIFTDLITQNVEAVMVYVKHRGDSGIELPLGVIVIPTDMPFNSPRMELDGMYDLEPTTGVPLDPKGNLQVRGKVHLKMMYFNVIDPEVVMDSQESASHAPNLLTIKVIDGTHIGLVQGYKHGVEAIVQVEVGELRQTTCVSKRSSSPEWNDVLVLPVDDGNELVDVLVKNSSLLRNVFLGRCRITMNEVADSGESGLIKTFVLYNETLQYHDQHTYGTLQLHLTWEYNDEVNARKAAAAKKPGVVYKAFKGVVGALGDLTGLGRKSKKDKDKDRDKDKGRDKDQDKEHRGDSAVKSQTRKDDDERASLEDARKTAARGNKRLTDQFDLANMSPFELATFLDEERRGRKAEIAELLDSERLEDDMPEGDYNIMIHLLELNDIRLDPSGRPPNPMVYVECFGKKSHSKPLYGTTSDFFDEVFYFSMPALRRDQIAETFVKFTVVDHFKLDLLKKGWFDSTIGVYTLDLSTIYRNKDHELHRKWGTLRDPHNNLDSGPQGLIKYSAVCLGPGDVQRMHDSQKEDDEVEDNDLDTLEDDLQKTEGAGVVDIGTSTRVPSTVGASLSQTLQFLVIGVLRADGLPGYDRFISTTRKGLYAYVQCEFAGCKPVKTTKVSCSGTENLSITFEEELWLPVWVPTLCKRVAITIRNSELGRSDQTLATAYIDFQRIARYSEDPIKTPATSLLGFAGGTYDGKPLQLIHFYGANPRVRNGPKAAHFMNKFPNHGSAYRGSLVASLRVVKHSRVTEAAHKVRMSYDIPATLVPQFTTYSLKAMIYQGSDFGSLGIHAAKGSGILYSTDYSLSITLGEQEFRTSYKAYSDGSVDWLELCEQTNLLLPKDLSQLPDTFVTVYKGAPSSNTSVAFLRLKTVELLAVGTKSVPRWYDLQHDQSHSQTSVTSFPGSVLLRLSLVNMQDAGLTGDWELDRKKMRIKQAYCLRALIYQCRSLPAVTDKALIDPYIKLRFCGAKQKTKTLRNTQNPIYFETLEFHKELPADLRLAPNVVLQVWDNKFLGKFPVAALRVPVSEIPVSKNVNYQEDVPPKWQKLQGIDGSGDMGEVLVHFLLIEKSSVEQVILPARKIEPSLRKCYLDIHAIGLRGLQSRGLTNIRMPYLYFDLFSSGYGDSAKSEASRSPSPTNPNFLDRHIIQTYLPDDPLYCPVLEVHVYDQRYTDKTLLGIISVDLRSKLPWNADDFVPPRQHRIMSEAAKAKEQLVKDKEVLAKQERKNREKARGQNIANMLGGQAAPLDSAFDQFSPLLYGDSEQKQNLLRDEGGGVFPTKADASELESPYFHLPRIKDRDEEKEEQSRRMKKYDREKNAESKNAGGNFADRSALGSAKEEELLLKSLIGFPTSWTAYDFLSGRDWWMKSQADGEGGQLEDLLQTYAFENYDLMRGHVAFNKFSRRRNTLRKVGYLKAVIRVTAKNPRYEEEFSEFVRAYRSVEKVVVRVYVLKAQHLLPTDIFGSSTSKQAADPYIRIKLGDVEVKDVVNVQKRSLNPDFFMCYEFTTTIAGPSKLHVGVWDKNWFTPDSLMGETLIDLEDRWFHPKWSALRLKPAEVRTLYKPGGGSSVAAGNLTSQGLLTLWVDIFTQAEAALEENAKVEISGPARQKFQLRIVTWRSQDVPNIDNGASDLFMRYTMQGSAQHYITDTHWRCKDGKGSWNYRSLIPIELPIKKREEGRLNMEMMEKNILTANSFMGIHVFNLYDWLMLAYKRQGTVFPLKERREKMKERERMLAAGTQSSGFIVPSVEVDRAAVDQDSDDDDLANGTDASEESNEDDDSESAYADGMDDNQPLLAKSRDKDAYGSARAGKKTKNRKNSKKKKTATPKEGKKDKDAELAGDVDGIELTALAAAPAPESESNIAAIFNQINVYLGVGDSVADDADWFNVTFKDRDTNDEKYMGRVAVSISIVPESEYETDPVGSGRNEPNKDPYLPPPNGRLSFSLNPMAIFYELCSPRVIFALVCCLCCAFIVVFMMLIGTQLSGWLALLKLLKGDI